MTNPLDVLHKSYIVKPIRYQVESSDVYGFFTLGYHNLEKNLIIISDLKNEFIFNFEDYINFLNANIRDNNNIIFTDFSNKLLASVRKISPLITILNKIKRKYIEKKLTANDIDNLILGMSNIKSEVLSSIQYLYTQYLLTVAIAQKKAIEYCNLSKRYIPPKLIPTVGEAFGLLHLAFNFNVSMKDNKVTLSKSVSAKSYIDIDKPLPIIVSTISNDISFMERYGKIDIDKLIDSIPDSIYNISEYKKYNDINTVMSNLSSNQQRTYMSDLLSHYYNILNLALLTAKQYDIMNLNRNLVLLADLEYNDYEFLSLRADEINYSKIIVSEILEKYKNK